jgi:hypothetical protein
LSSDEKNIIRLSINQFNECYGATE